MTQVSRHPRALLERIFEGAVTAVAPGPAVQRAVAGLDVAPGTWVRVLALGKAAVPMAAAADDALSARGLRVRDGLVVPPQAALLPRPDFLVVPGDHPLPGPRSRQAAAAVERFARDGRPGDLVLVLLSGGTSSLVAAPVPGFSEAALAELHAWLLAAGLPIHDTNRLRRRFSRWGAGRLALALAPARVEVLAISDVPGDALGDIGSGPCSPDPDSADGLTAWLREAGLRASLPAAALDHLDATRAGRWLETPKAGDPALAGVASRIVAANGDAVRGALRAAEAAGLEARAAGEPLAGEAAAMGRRIARRLVDTPPAGVPTCLVWGGETVVRLATGTPGSGGRCQELALAAAEVLAEARGELPALLAAGTDGRDGATPAAGGHADPGTWRRIGAAGRDPARDLATHHSHPALQAAGALLLTGPTGTNVMDLVIALPA